MCYEGTIYRPPSEADAYIVEATIGCSWNARTYRDMYRAKRFRVRDLDQTLADIWHAGEWHAAAQKVFVADGDALAMDLAQREPILYLPLGGTLPEDRDRILRALDGRVRLRPEWTRGV